MLVFFLKVRNSQCGYHCSLSSLTDSFSGSEDAEAETGRLAPGQEATEADASTDQRAAK
jgi:hypothetical protein